MQMADSSSYPPLGPLSPEPMVDVPIDGQEHGGFALLLHELLGELGVPAESIKYTCNGKLASNGQLEGFITVRVQVPASEVVPELHAFFELEVDTSIDYYVQSVSRMAMGTIMRELHECLKDGRFHQLHSALDPHKGIFA